MRLWRRVRARPRRRRRRRWPWIAAAMVVVLLLVARDDEPPPHHTPDLPRAGAPLSEKRILFSSDRSGTYEIYSMRRDGTRVRRLTADRRFDAWWPRVSPNRRRVLFYRTPAGTHDRDYGKTSLWMMRNDGSGQVELRPPGTDGWDVQGHAEWSPDGKRLVMFGGERINPQIYTTRVRGQGARALTGRGGQNLDPSWGVDGRTIYFVGCPSFICFPGDYEIYRLAPSGKAQRLTHDDLRDHDPYVSPDGRRLAWLTRTSKSGPAGEWNIRMSRPDGSGARWVIRDHNINSYPAWSEAGDRIYFHRLELGRSSHFEIFTIRPDGRDLRQLTRGRRAASEYPSP